MAPQVQSVPGSHIQGWMSEGELQWLFDTAARMQSVVEIGCWKGRSTFALCASGCPIVYAVDHFLGSDEAEHKAIIEAEHPIFDQYLDNTRQFLNLRTIPMCSRAAAEALPSVDMVFIDGGHDYASVAEDLRLWEPKAKGLLCGHDFYFPAVQRALLERCGGRKVEVYQTIWSMEVKQ